MKQPKSHVGERLRTIRQMSLLTTEEAAEKVGLSNGSAITRIELGEGNIMTDTLRKFCEIYECNSSDILDF